MLSTSQIISLPIFAAAFLDLGAVCDGGSQKKTFDKPWLSWSSGIAMNVSNKEYIAKYAFDDLKHLFTQYALIEKPITASNTRIRE